jgi:hypothetical protein
MRGLHLHVLRIAPVAVDAQHVAGLGRHDLAEGERARRRVGEVANPVDSRRARRHIDEAFEARLVGEAHIAAGNVRLLGLPVLALPLNDGLDPASRSASHGVDGG